VLGLEAVSHGGRQDSHDRRVELGACAAFELGNGILWRTRRPVGARRCHRDIGVTGGDDACGQRDFLPGKTVGVTGAVPVLVRRANDRGDAAKRR